MSLSKTSLVALLLLAIGVSLLASLIGSISVLSGGFAGFGFDVPQSPGKFSINPGWWLGGLTAIGIAASLAVNILRAQDQQARVDFKVFFQSMLRPQTFIALCVSPVVFFGVLLALDGKDLGPATYLAAFQNGFFWQRILDAKQ